MCAIQSETAAYEQEVLLKNDHDYVYKKIIFLSYYKLYMSGRLFENEPEKSANR